MTFFRLMCCALLAALLWPATASAFKRAARPLTVAIPQADAIVVARTTRVPERLSRGPGQTAEITITHSLKGKLSGGSLTVQLNEAHSMALGVLQPNQEYLLFLRAADKEPTRQEIMLDGTQLYKEEDAKQIESLIALTPDWSPPEGGISTVITAEKYRIKSGEDLNLYIGCRNVSDTKIVLKYSDWPLATHTYWELDIVPEGGTGIPASTHPHLTPERINDYFAKFPHTYEVTLEPRQEFFFPLQRVNSAKPGWGYKEALDFKYYPMEQPGKYDIAAKCHNFRTGKSISAKGLQVWVE